MNYQDYDVEDFVMNSSFQNYCLDRKSEDVLFWRAWIIEHPEKYEKIQQALKLFIVLNGNLNAHQFKQSEQAFKAALYRHLHKEDTEVSANVTTVVSLREKPKRSRNLLLYAAGIAASLLLVLIALYLNDNKHSPALADAPLSVPLTYTCLPGERKSFQLPDGSTVLMNGGSSIKVSKDFNTANREISLKGEAYFNVTHNAHKPFIIHTNTINVKVLGTEFDVKAYPEDKTTETVLIRGSVEVTVNSKPEEKIILMPHHKLIIQNDSEVVTNTVDSAAKIQKVIPEKIRMLSVTVNPDDSTMAETLWTENRLSFNNETLAEVAAKLERWYGVKVSVGTDIAQKYKFTGIFENETIDETLKALQLSLFFHYRIEDGKILITK